MHIDVRIWLDCMVNIDMSVCYVSVNVVWQLVLIRIVEKLCHWLTAPMLILDEQ